LSFGIAERGSGNELGTGLEAGLMGWEPFRGGAGQFRGGPEAALFLAGGSTGSGLLKGWGAVFEGTRPGRAGAGAAAGGLPATGGNGMGAGAGAGAGAGVAGVKAWESVLPSSARRPGCMVGRLRRRAGAALSAGGSGAGGMAGKGGVSSATGTGFGMGALMGGRLLAGGAGGMLAAGLVSGGKTGADVALARTGSRGWRGG